MNNIIIFTSKINDIMFWYYFKNKQIFVNTYYNKFSYSDRINCYTPAYYVYNNVAQIVYWNT